MSAKKLGKKCQNENDEKIRCKKERKKQRMDKNNTTGNNENPKYMHRTR